MIIYPAIDIKNGQCVRLSEGKFDSVSVYSDEPFKIAEKFVKLGARFIHTVDLDGAKEGVRKNAEAIRKITEIAGKIPVQLGGGIRDMKSVEEAFELGIHRVIIGTAAVENQQFVKAAAEKFGDRIAVGIDASGGMVATRGWETVTEVSAVELAKKMSDFGVKTIIYTDIATDGMLKGPNFEAMREMASSVDADIIASGGVSCIEDVINLKDTGVSGVIVGKAIYEGRVDLKKMLGNAL